MLKASACAGTVPLTVSQDADHLHIALPGILREKTAPVIKLECDVPPAIYRTGGMRDPRCEHPRYDPVQPDIQYD